MRPIVVWTSFLGSVLLVMGKLASLANGEETTLPEAMLDPATLVLQLGDDSYIKRENARLELQRREDAAFTALEAGLKSDDLEVQYHCERLLIDIRDLQIQRRLEEFAADEDKSRDYDFPGWSNLRELVGDEPHIRRLFVEMYRAEPDILRAFSESRSQLSSKLTDRAILLQQLRNRKEQTISLGTTAVMLLGGGLDEVKLPANGCSLTYQLCYQPGFREILDAPEHGPVLRKILGTFMDNADTGSALQGLTLSTQLNLPEQGKKLAERALSGTAAPHIKQYALLTLAKQGSDEHLELIGKSLDDKTICSTQLVNKVKYETQLRDVALFAIMHLSKQDPKSFGFERMTPNPQLIVNVHTLGFPNDTERQAVVEKWQKFVDDEKAKSADAKQK